MSDFQKILQQSLAGHCRWRDDALTMISTLQPAALGNKDLRTGLLSLVTRETQRQTAAGEAFLADVVQLLMLEDPMSAPLPTTLLLCQQMPELMAEPALRLLCAARAKAAKGDAAAATAYRMLLERDEIPPPIIAGAVYDLYRLGHRTEALDVLWTRCIHRGYVEADNNFFIGTLLARGDHDGAVRLFQRRCLTGNLPAPDAAALARDRAAAGIPTILTTTLPKSGSVYLIQQAAAALQVPVVEISIGRFPVDRVIPDLARVVAGGGYAVQEHFDPSPDNLAALRRAGLTRVHVHIRDPRQSTLSWLHHVDTEWRLPHSIGRFDAPDDYSGWPADRKRRYQIDTWYDGAVHWIERWLAVADDANGFSVQFSEFQQLKADGIGTVHRMLRFFDAPEALLPEAVANPKEVKHYRRGTVDEWRTVFTADERRRMSDRLSDALCTRFNWVRDPDAPPAAEQI